MPVQQEDPTQLLDQIENLSRTHREHELYYSQAPLDDAVTLQQTTGGRDKEIVLGVERPGRSGRCG
jgi:hypothetical protein